MTESTPARARALFYAHGRKEVLSGVDIDLPAGRVTAIVGANGAGKTTLVELLAGVRSPQAGEVLLAAPVALVVQRPDAPAELPITAREVVTLGAASPARGRPRRSGALARRVRDALVRVGAEELTDAPFAQLSGGQRQRVLIAQGLAVGAGVLILDEPAAGLDESSRARARGILREEADRGVAVACVTHDAADVEAADRVVTLRDGVAVLTR